MNEHIRLVVGLGNPGEKYRRNRHNIGFRVLDRLAVRRGLKLVQDDPAFRQARDTSVEPGLVLLEPRSYMNLSGEAVLRWAALTGTPVTGRSDLPADESRKQETDTPEVRPLVVCDDLNLPLGSLRLRPRGGSGGQNGLASLIDCLGGEEFPRMRLGIAPPAEEIAPERWPDYVLADFTPEEEEAVSEIVRHACDAIEFWLEHGLERAISRFNRRIRPADGEAI